MSAPPIHLSGLNGIRAIAAFGVLIFHTTVSLDSFGLDPYIFGRNSDGQPRGTLLGGFGVSMFFALSGFLITFLLLKEKQLGEINIKHFYIRRLLRIWPLYYLYLAIALITCVVFQVSFIPANVIFYVFLLANIPYIFGFSVPLIAHYWSIGVEEQFYSFWPWLISKSRNVLGMTTALVVALVVLKIGLRLYDIKYHAGGQSWPYEVLHVTRFQCMLVGSAGAILFFEENTLFRKIANHRVVQFFSWAAIVLVAVNKFHIASFIDNEIICCLTVFIIVGQILKSNRLINLDTPVFDFLGKISYGIYVLHPLVIFYLSKAVRFETQSSFVGYVFIFSLVILTTIFTSYLSFQFFEKRFLEAKGPFTHVASSASKTK
jgi:peptidoglycan/LPS O-acetylase OafA/YrhL